MLWLRGDGPAGIARSQGADLLVVGARWREGFDRRLLGSVTRQGLHLRAGPVDVVRTEHGR
jgi:nucleotide-binding universal stress UspA family protein